VVVQPDGGPGTVVAELLAAKVRLVSVAASNAVAAAATPRTARRGRLWRVIVSGGLVASGSPFCWAGGGAPAWAGLSGRERSGCGGADAVLPVRWGAAAGVRREVAGA
jgi:hypothetical protein